MNTLTPLSIVKKKPTDSLSRKWIWKLRFIRLLKDTKLGGMLHGLLRQLPHIQPLLRLNIGYFAQTGWPRTALGGNYEYAADKDGHPIPWYSYSGIHFLNERLRPNMTLFEYGCGQSTLYYEKKGLIIDAVEHNLKWVKRIQKATGKNVRIHHTEDTAQYNTFIHSLKKHFHIIVIDGLDRSTCLKEAVQALRADGVIIVDDSEFIQLQASLWDLTHNGFKILYFLGLSPVFNYTTHTSILYRTKNCLGI